MPNLPGRLASLGRQVLPWLMKHPLVPLAIVVAGFFGRQAWVIRGLRERNVQLALDKTNLAARADTDRTLHVGALKALRAVYGDSVRAVQHLVVQERQKNSALDKALQLQSSLTGVFRFQVDSLHAVIAGTPVVTDSADVRHDHFQVDTIPPYHVTADVALPAAGSGRLWLGITQDPFRVRVHVGCGEVNRDGVRPATAVLTFPAYLRGGIDSVTQDRETCNREALARARRSLGGQALRTGADIVLWEVAKWGLRRLKVIR